MFGWETAEVGVFWGAIISVPLCALIYWLYYRGLKK